MNCNELCNVFREGYYFLCIALNVKVYLLFFASHFLLLMLSAWGGESVLRGRVKWGSCRVWPLHSPDPL